MLRSKKMTAVVEPGANGERTVIRISQPGAIGRLAKLISRLSGMAQRLFGLTLRLFGLGLAGTGAAHFLAPEPFDRLTAVAFPDETRRWTLSNGATELILGLAVASRRTRLVGLAGFLAYAAFLTQRLISTQNSQN